MRPFASRFLAVSPVERVKRGSGGGVLEEGVSLSVLFRSYFCVWDSAVCELYNDFRGIKKLGVQSVLPTVFIHVLDVE